MKGELTAEENRKIKAMLVAVAEIKKKHKVVMEWENPTGKNKAAEGHIECPICKGRLNYTISSYNGHVWGQCETEGCLSWMM